MSFKDFIKLIDEKFKAVGNAPFDPFAIKEAEKLCFKNALIPFNSSQKKYTSIKLMPVKNISEAIESSF